LVTKINPGAASRAGILADDVILMIDNKPVSSALEFRKLVKGLPEDRAIAVLVQRSDGSLFLALRLDKK
jgi:serine protease Do